MKLGSLKEGGRDGTLIVVDRAVKAAVRASSVAPTLQKALDDWATAEPKLRALAAAARRGQGARRLRSRHQGARGTAAARLSVGRRLGLRRACRAGAQGARRGDAAVLLDRSADVPGRLRFLHRPQRRHRGGRRGPWHRFRRRDRRDRRRRADGRVARGGAPAHQAGHHPERRVAAQRHRHRAGQGLRLLPRQARHGLRAGRRHARRAGRRLGWRQAQPAADLDLQRQGVRPSQRRHRSHLRFRPAHRPCRQDASSRGRHGRRLGHRRQPRRRRRLLLHRRAARARDHRQWQACDAVHEVRRSHPHRNVRSRRPVDLRRHRPEGRALHADAA